MSGCVKISDVYIALYVGFKHVVGPSWPTAHRTPWAFVHILTFHLILHTCWMLRNWSGVGGGGMITFLALAHMLDATQLVRGGWGGGW